MPRRKTAHVLCAALWVSDYEIAALPIPVVETNHYLSATLARRASRNFRNKSLLGFPEKTCPVEVPARTCNVNNSIKNNLPKKSLAKVIEAMSVRQHKADPSQFPTVRFYPVVTPSAEARFQLAEKHAFGKKADLHATSSQSL